VLVGDADRLAATESGQGREQEIEMSKARAWAVVALGAALVAGSTACAAPAGGDPTAGCSDQARSAGEPGDAEPLLILGSAQLSPTIVYSDGAVVIPVSAVEAFDGGAAATGFLRVPLMMPGYAGDEPGGFEAGWLSDCELEVVTNLADDLFTDGVDFGDPQVTDMDSTSISYGDQTESVYAFTRDDPGEWGALSASQREARHDLARLWDVVETSAELDGALEIDRLFLMFYGSIADDELPEWPLPIPISELSQHDCATVTAPAEVEALLELLSSREELLPDPVWRLAVVAAAPGVPDCG
jgi:hypothetical protein